MLLRDSTFIAAKILHHAKVLANIFQHTARRLSSPGKTLADVFQWTLNIFSIHFSSRAVWLNSSGICCYAFIICFNQFLASPRRWRQMRWVTSWQFHYFSHLWLASTPTRFLMWPFDKQQQPLLFHSPLLNSRSGKRNSLHLNEFWDFSDDFLFSFLLRWRDDEKFIS